MNSTHLNTQALVVAGGNVGSTPISLVLTLLPGATAWVPLASLPRALNYVRASIVGGRLRLAGGDDGGPKITEVSQVFFNPSLKVLIEIAFPSIFAFHNFCAHLVYDTAPIRCLNINQSHLNI